MADTRWLLPAGIEELLPLDAWRLESLRRRALTLMRSWGYELVVPPLVEYLDSLLTGVGEDLDIETYKLTDQESGRLLGLRADMTPQVARIDARYLYQDHPVRLCYIGPVLHTRASSPGESREPLQLGAELFGSASPAADSEIIELLVSVLQQTGIQHINLDLGHVGIFHALIEAAGVPEEDRPALYDAMQKKSIPDLKQALTAAGTEGGIKAQICALTECHGEAATINQTVDRYAQTLPGVRQSIQNLQAVLQQVCRRLPQVEIGFDLAEIRGYQYHTGVVFSAYVPGMGKEVGRGGRYDNVGQAFGNARPATGFSCDARRLLALLNVRETSAEPILAPAEDDADCRQLIADLRLRGEKVVRCLHEDDATVYARRIVRSTDGWMVTVA